MTKHPQKTELNASFSLDRGPEVGVPHSFVTDTMSTVLAGLAKRPLEGQDGDPVFHPGRYYALTVATIDTNYYDFVRSGGNLYTGRGFITSVDGAFGGDPFFPFGEFPLSFVLRIDGDTTDYYLSASPSDLNVPFDMDVRTLTSAGEPEITLAVERVRT